VSRRAFLYGAIAGLAAPGGVRAQQTAKVYRVGFLRNGLPPDTFLEALRRGLRDLGHQEGQNVSLEYGLADSADQLPSAVTHLLRLNVDVILASGTPPVPVAKKATQTVSIVFVASIDPVATGIVASLARPGGNVTGVVGIHSELS
jgi:ABC transporter substrate binding protein